MRYTRTSAAALAGLLASCTVGPDYRPPKAVSGEPAAAPTLLGASDPAFNVDPPPGEWWRLYDSPELDALVAKALVHNGELRIALANLEAAQATLRGAELARIPRTALSAGATYGQASADEVGAPQALDPGPVFGLVESVSYDFDLFGRLRRGIETRSADVDAARAALDLERVNIAAAVAGAYANACAAGNQIVVTNRSVALAQQIVSVTQRRFRGGIVGSNDVVRARALLAQTKARLPDQIARQRAALYLLAMLTGDPPEAFPQDVARCTTPPVIRRPIPVGDGASLLKRRPDVRESERSLAASVAEIGVATSALYPEVSLGGQVGTFATRGSDIARDRGFKWNLGPLVSWSFPNRAIARSEIARTNAVARANLAQFDHVVRTALRETETALTALAQQLDAERDLKEARDQSAIAAHNTERLYAGGIGEFIDMLDTERTLIEADATLADATAQVSNRQVQLFLALGGGWQGAPPPAETPLDGIAVPHQAAKR